MERYFIELDAADQHLRGRMPKMVEALNEAATAAHVPSGAVSYHPALSPSTKAAIAVDVWHDCMRDFFATDRGVEFMEVRSQRFLLIDGALVLRFKQMNNHLGTQNYPTK